MYARRVENASAAEAEGSRWSATIKAHEVVLRRVAARQGLRLERSRRRDPRALGFGTYRIVDSEIARRPYLRINYPGRDIDPAEREEAATVKLGYRLLHRYLVCTVTSFPRGSRHVIPRFGAAVGEGSRTCSWCQVVPVPGRLRGRYDGPSMRTWWLVLMSRSSSDSATTGSGTADTNPWGPGCWSG